MAFFPLTSKYGAQDISPTRNKPGRIVGVVPVSGPNGQPGSAFKFRGRPDSFIEFPNKGGLDTKNSITILGYVNPESPGPIFNYNPRGFGMHLWMVRRNVLFARFVKRNKKFTRPVATNRVKPGTWHWVGATYDRNTGYARLYVDSRKTAERYLGRIKLATNYPVRMGARVGDRRFFRGKITCVQVYNVALTRQQIRAARKNCFKPGWLGSSIVYSYLKELLRNERDLFQKEFVLHNICDFHLGTKFLFTLHDTRMIFHTRTRISFRMKTGMT